MPRIASYIRCILCFLAMGCSLIAEDGAPGADQVPSVDAIRENAVKLARSGSTAEALSLFRQGVQIAPYNIPLLRDYAVVLGWAEEYRTAIEVIHSVIAAEPQQPDWALQEFARSFLFGDEPVSALEILNQLIARGDTSETVLLRRALALRWIGRPNEAQTAYEVVRELYPESGAAAAGIVYCLGDKGKLAEALRVAEAGLRELPNNPDLLKSKIRMLNWMGRHLEAQQELAKIPASFLNDREIIEDQISAARWGGRPGMAVQAANRLQTAFPDHRDTMSLARELHLEYGSSFSSGFRYASDRDGLIDKTWSGGLSLHLSPAHEIQTGYLYRQLEQEGSVLFWRRYELGWTGVFGRHLRAYATASDVNYGDNSQHRIVGDGGLSFVVSDSMKITAGGGTIAMDAFHATQHHVTAPFEFGEIFLTPDMFTQVQARYSRYSFSDGVRRDRADLEFGRLLHSQTRFKFKLGWRSNLMWHSRETSDFYSPSSFQSHLPYAQGYGRLFRDFDYSLEVGGGWQFEPATPQQNPLQLSGKLVWHRGQAFRAVIEAGRTTSSLERVFADRTPYSRRFISISLLYSF